MGTIGTYNFGRAKLRHNVFIGGVAGTLSTPALLAYELGVTEQRIRLFEIRGNDIRFCVVGNYGLDQSAFNESGTKPATGITYYDDKFGDMLNGLTTQFGYSATIKYVNIPKVKGIFSNGVFEHCVQMRSIRMESLTTLTAPNGLRNVTNCKIYFPSLQNLGSPNVNEGTYAYVTSSVIYSHPSLATCNAGQPDADLIAAIAAGNTVIYVQNQTKPERITNLSIGLKTGSTAQINFTAPTSVNTLQEYEVSIDGVIWQTITASGQYITGLTSGVEYKNITVKAIDIYYNRAEESNQITFTTL